MFCVSPPVGGSRCERLISCLVVSMFLTLVCMLLLMMSLLLNSPINLNVILILFLNNILGLVFWLMLILLLHSGWIFLILSIIRQLWHLFRRLMRLLPLSRLRFESVIVILLLFFFPLSLIPGSAKRSLSSGSLSPRLRRQRLSTGPANRAGAAPAGRPAGAVFST